MTDAPPELTLARRRIIGGLLRGKTGNDVLGDRAYVVVPRLERLARKLDLDLDGLVARLATGRDPALEQDVVESLLNHETFFFRDIRVFEHLRKEVLPTLLDQARPTRALRVWCGACSSGQEPYSVAMMLLAHFPELASWDVTIHASDVSLVSVQRTREAVYTQLEVNRGLPAAHLLEFFTRKGEGWVLEPRVREMVEVSRINLIEPWPHLRPFDLVLLRNVLIYFDEHSRQTTVERALDHIRNQGALLLGGAESNVPTWAKDRMEAGSVGGVFRVLR